MSAIHLSSNKYHQFKPAIYLGKPIDLLKEIGERKKLKRITGLAYLSHLVPYKLEEISKQNMSLIISDRDPILDPLCYCNFYLPKQQTKTIYPLLKTILTSFFNYPEHLFYLDVSPQEAMKRNPFGEQLHEKKNSLTELRNIFKEKIHTLKKENVKITEINTNSKSLEEVIEEVTFCIKNITKKLS